MSEKVLVVPRNKIEAQLRQGFFEDEGGELMGRLSGLAEFMDRPAAEQDPTHKQVIPYFAVTQGDRFLMYKRLPKQGETRLHNKYSLGFGGHINPIDQAQGVPIDVAQSGGDLAQSSELRAQSRTNLILAALVRELNEELFVPSVKRISAVGYINDDANAVGQVHLGAAFVVELGNDQFAVNEPDMIEAQWYDADGVEKVFPSLETWSQLLWGSCLKLAGAR